MHANNTPADDMRPLKIGEKIARLPIVQGGMGVGISLSRLASAVANEGGVGVIAAAMIGMHEKDIHSNFLEANKRALANEIRKAREKTSGVLGVNIMVALTNFADMVRTSVKEGADVIFSGAGLPMNLPSFVDEGSKTSLVPIVSSARAAKLICKKWLAKYSRLPDAFVVEGPLAGGHLGFKREELDEPGKQLETITRETVDEVKTFEDQAGQAIPVIAAGGVYTGADIRKFIELGASGVQMGTRFVATEECDADDRFKQAFVDATEEDVCIIDSPVGLPGRAIRNNFLSDVAEGLKKPFKCPYHCITTCDHTKSPYCIALALTNAKRGLLKNGFAFAGKNAFRIDKITTVKELFASLISEYRASGANPA